ncbi:MAG TPA: amidohydrolase [Naasia sp.]
MEPDLLVHRGRVFDGETLTPATAVAVSGGVVVAVGSDEEAAAAVAPGATRIDAGGGLIGPGFLDSHVHPPQGGRERLTCDLTDATDARTTLDMVARYAADHPDAEWIVGGGWHMPHFEGGLPRAELLEQIAPGRNIYLVNADHHGAWVSPAALAAAGIDRDFPDPADGHIDRDAQGVPTGTLQEGAMELYEHLLPVPTEQEWVDALIEAERYLRSFGITGWQDAIVGGYAGVPDVTDAYLRGFDSGVLSGRVTAALWLPRGFAVGDVEEVVARLVAQRERIGLRTNEAGGTFRATTVKIMQDGVPESLTAALKQPYLDAHGHPTDRTGPSHFPPEVLDAAAVALAREGFQLHIHAIGDRAIAEAPIAKLRHHLAHLQQVDLADLGTMASLGVTANLQALWACNSDQMTELNLPLVGEERFSQQYPFASMVRAGIPLAMGSDWPVSTPDPWQAIHVAVNRTEPGETRYPPLGQGEELQLVQALSAYTSGSARVTHHDDAGRIRVGLRADLAVADRDPFSIPVDEIATVRNTLTVSAGRVVATA